MWQHASQLPQRLEYHFQHVYACVCLVLSRLRHSQDTATWPTLCIPITPGSMQCRGIG